MHILPPVRPEESIQRLTALLTPIAEKMVVVPRKRMTWTHKNQPQLFLFLDGELSILRASDGLLIVTVYHPHLFGIAEMIQPVRGHQLRAETESTILRVDAQKAMEVFRQHGVWEDVASLLSYHTAYLFYRDALVVQQRTYAVIRNHLQEMGQATRRDPDAGIYPGLYPGTYALITQQCIKRVVGVKKW